MSARLNFKVTPPQVITKPLLFLDLFFIVLSIIYTVVEGSPNYPMYILITLIVILPSVIVFLWFKLFRVQVNNRTITVRKGNGRQYRLDISDVIHIEWKKVDTDFMHSEKITVTTSSGHFSVDSAMVGFDKMAEYISDHVCADKIHIAEKDRRSKKE